MLLTSKRKSSLWLSLPLWFFILDFQVPADAFSKSEVGEVRTRSWWIAKGKTKSPALPQWRGPEAVCRVLSAFFCRWSVRKSRNSQTLKTSLRSLRLPCLSYLNLFAMFGHVRWPQLWLRPKGLHQRRMIKLSMSHVSWVSWAEPDLNFVARNCQM